MLGRTGHRVSPSARAIVRHLSATDIRLIVHILICGVAVPNEPKLPFPTHYCTVSYRCTTDEHRRAIEGLLGSAERSSEAGMKKCPVR